MHDEIVDKGYAIFKYDEPWYTHLYLGMVFQPLKKKDWECEICKITSGPIYNILRKYEYLAFGIYEEIINEHLYEHYESPGSMSSILYYGHNDGFHGEHTDWGFFNVLLFDESPNCFYVNDDLVDCQGKGVILTGEGMEKYGLTATPHKVIKNSGYERYLATRQAYPIDKLQELDDKGGWNVASS